MKKRENRAGRQTMAETIIPGLLFILMMILSQAWAEAFDSGSTGADGAFSPATSTALVLPPNGIFNFTTVNIPSGVTVTVTRNATNTPVVILATGTVTITGTLDIRGGTAANSGTSGNGNLTDDGVPGEGGPGGFRGGVAGLGGGFGGSAGASGGDGLGPGGGGAGSGVLLGPSDGGGGGFGVAGSASSFSGTGTGAVGGGVYGTTRLLPLVGGSGGGGGAGGSGFTGSGGGGGGGAVLLASSGTITVTGFILADGGTGGSSSGTGCGGNGGGGSGGAIRVTATTISGSGSLLARGGAAGTSCSNRGVTAQGGNGRIRLEATTFLFSGPATPTYSPGPPGQVFSPGLPTLAVAAIGGMAAPSAPSGAFATPDLTLPIGTASPVTVSLAAANIPVGTVITVTRFLERGAKQTVNSTALSGADASATTATASIALSSGVTAVVQASATFTVQVASNPFPTFVEGEKVEKIRVAATFGGPSMIFLITESGKEIPYQGVMMN